MFITIIACLSWQIFLHTDSRYKFQLQGTQSGVWRDINESLKIFPFSGVSGQCMKGLKGRGRSSSPAHCCCFLAVRLPRQLVEHDSVSQYALHTHISLFPVYTAPSQAHLKNSLLLRSIFPSL